MTQTKKVLITHSAIEDDALFANHNFAHLLNDFSDNIDVHILHYDEIYFVVDNGVKAYSIIDDTDITSYDLVYLKKVLKREENALALANVLSSSGKKYICTEIGRGISTTKLSQYSILASANIPLPKTIYIPNKHLVSSYKMISEKIGIPFVLKDTGGRGGEANYLVSNAQEFEDIVDRHPKTEFVAQAFVKNDSDLRVLVFGNKVRMIIERRRLDDSTHLNNTSQGAKAKIIDLKDIDRKILEISVNAAMAMEREVAGVDIMIELDTNKPYVLEVNASPQIGSGAYVEEKIHKFNDYLQEVLQNNNKSDIISA